MPTDRKKPREKSPGKTLYESLLEAVNEHNAGAVKQALAKGAKINTADKAGNTVLHLIATKCDPQDKPLLDVLLEHNSSGHELERAYVLRLNNGGQSALSIAEEKDKSA